MERRAQWLSRELLQLLTARDPGCVALSLLLAMKALLLPNQLLVHCGLEELELSCWERRVALVERAACVRV